MFLFIDYFLLQYIGQLYNYALSEREKNSFVIHSTIAFYVSIFKKPVKDETRMKDIFWEFLHILDNPVDTHTAEKT